MTPSTTTTYQAIECDEGHERALGTITMDEKGLLAIIEATPDENAQLETIVGELNAEDILHQDAQPPAGARPFEVFTRPIPRGTEGFVPALLEHLQRYHGIELRPV